MSDELVFMMGQFAARFPVDRQYGRNHMWAQPRDNVYRCGLSAYAVRLLQDVYFIDWTIDAGTNVREREPIGTIESSKAESDLYSPMQGNLATFNAEILSDPSLINVDTYHRGWLFSMESAGSELLSPEEYLKHLEGAWLIAQRTIKGQMNE